MDSFAQLMQERPDGIETDQSGEFADGFTTYSAAHDDEDEAGMVAHRGVLHPDEYVDPSLLRLMVERRIGFTYEEIASAYRNGRPTTDQRQLRARIDARLLALSRAGGNMTRLSETIGLGHATVERALARARLEER